jgi:hypothetical protein
MKNNATNTFVPFCFLHGCSKHSRPLISTAIQLLKLAHFWKAAETTAIRHRYLLQIQDGGMFPRNFAKFLSRLLKGQCHEIVTGYFQSVLFYRITGGFQRRWTGDFKCREVKTGFYRNKCKPVLLGLSLAGNLVKPLLSLYGTEWRERGYGLCKNFQCQNHRFRVFEAGYWKDFQRIFKISK